MQKYIDADKLTKQLDDDFAEAIKNGTDTFAFAEARNFLLNVLVKQEPADVVSREEYMEVYKRMVRLDCELDNRRYMQSINWDDLPPIGGFHD